MKNLRSSVFWTAGESLTTLLYALIVGFLVARLIGPTEFGLASLTLMVGTLAEALISALFVDALIRCPYADVKMADTAFTAMAASGVAGFLLLVAAGPLLASVYDAPVLRWLVLLQASSCLLLGIRGVPEALLARKLRFRSLAVRGIIAKACGAAVSLGLAWAGFGPWSLVIGYVASAATSTVTIMRVTARRPRLRFNRVQFEELASFGRFTFLDAVLWTATPRGFVALVGYFSGIQALGEIGIAFRLNDSVAALIGGLNSRIALPLLARAAVRDRAAFDLAVERGTWLTFMISAPAFTGLALVSREIVGVTVGPQWVNAAGAVVSVSLFSVFNFSTLMAFPAVKALGRPALAAYLHMLILPLVLAGATVAGPFGPAAQLHCWTAIGIFYALSCTWMVRLAGGPTVGAQLRPLVRTGLACAAMACVVLGLAPLLDQLALIIALLAKSLIGAAVFLVLQATLNRDAIRAYLAARRQIRHGIPT